MVHDREGSSLGSKFTFPSMKTSGDDPPQALVTSPLEYPATSSFTSDNNNSNPTGWDLDESAGEIKVIGNKTGTAGWNHDKVLLLDQNSSGNMSATMNLSFPNTTVLVWEDFDNETVGTSPNNWTSPNSSWSYSGNGTDLSILASDNAMFGGGKGGHLTDWNIGSNVNMNKSFNATSSGRFSIDFNPIIDNQTGSMWKQVYLIGQDGENNTVWEIIIFIHYNQSWQFIWKENGSGYDAESAFNRTDDTWYDLEVFFDCDLGRYSFYCDGTPVAEDVKMDSTGPVERLWIGTPEGPTIYNFDWYFDNISLTETDQGTVDLYTLPGDDTTNHSIQLLDSNNDIVVDLSFSSNGTIQAKDNATWVDARYGYFNYEPGYWYHVHIEFELSHDDGRYRDLHPVEHLEAGTFTVYINSRLEFEGLSVAQGAGNITQLRLSSNEIDSEAFYDAIDTSWSSGHHDLVIDGTSENITADGNGEYTFNSDTYYTNQTVHDITIVNGGNLTISGGNSYLVATGLLDIVASSSGKSSLTISGGATLDCRDGLRYVGTDAGMDGMEAGSGLDSDVLVIGDEDGNDARLNITGATLLCDGIVATFATLSFTGSNISTNHLTYHENDENSSHRQGTQFIEAINSTINCTDSFSAHHVYHATWDFTDVEINAPVIWITGKNKDNRSIANIKGTTINGLFLVNFKANVYITNSTANNESRIMALTTCDKAHNNTVIANNTRIALYTPSLRVLGDSEFLVTPWNGSEMQPDLIDTDFENYTVKKKVDSEWVDAAIGTDFVLWNITGDAPENVTKLETLRSIGVSVTDGLDADDNLIVRDCSTRETRLQHVPFRSLVENTSLSTTWVEFITGENTFINCEFFSLKEEIFESINESSVAGWSNWNAGNLGDHGNGMVASVSPNSRYNLSTAFHARYVNCWFNDDFKLHFGFPSGIEFYERTDCGITREQHTFIDCNYVPSADNHEFYGKDTGIANFMVVNSSIGAPASKDEFEYRKFYYEGFNVMNWEFPGNGPLDCELFVPENCYYDDITVHVTGQGETNLTCDSRNFTIDPFSSTGNQTISFNATYDETVYNVSRTFTFFSNATIDIYGNGELNSACTQGNGTAENPYVLEKLWINASSSGSAITIHDTNKYLVIRYSYVTGSGTIDQASGVYLDNCTNVYITSCIASENNKFGINLVDSNGNNVTRCVVESNPIRNIRIDSSDSNLLNDNFVSSCDIFNIQLNMADNNTINGNMVIDSFEGIAIYHSDGNDISDNDCFNNTNGIFLSESENNSIWGNNVSGNNNGIYLSVAHFNNVSGNTLVENHIGISYNWVHNNTIHDNTLIDNNETILKYEGSYDNIAVNNTLIVEGNVTCDYGIGDPYGNDKFIGNFIKGFTVGLLLDSVDGSEAVNNTIEDCGTAILMKNSSNVTLHHNTFLNNTGLALNVTGNSTNNSISYNNFTGNTQAIYLYGTSGNNITGNTLTSNGGAGIHLNTSNENIVHGNVLEGNEHGIYLEVSDYNNVSSNNVSLSTTYGIVVNGTAGSSNNTVFGNHVFENGNKGIVVAYSSDDNVISGNNASCNNGTGIHVGLADNNTIYDNIASSNKDVEGGGGHGITISWSTIANVTGNTASNNDKNGIEVASSSNVTVSGNTITGNGEYGLKASGDYHVFIGNNISSNGDDGLYIRSDNTTITGNDVASNGDDGMDLFADDNTISFNNISDNDDYGIEIISASSGNSIYHNNFVDNNGGSVQAHDPGNDNEWDDGSNHGNYWSDYETRYPDASATDGVWNESYVLDGGSGASDSLPLAVQNYQMPVHVDGDDDFANVMGIRGSGTVDDPYIIENRDINGIVFASGIGIEIGNTTKYFVIQNCKVHDCSSSAAGIKLENVTSGTIIDNEVANNSGQGIHLYNCSNVTIQSNNISYNADAGIFLELSSNNTVTGNDASHNDDNGILLDDSDGNTVSENTVTFNGEYGIKLENDSDDNAGSGNSGSDNSKGNYKEEGTCDNNNIQFS
ncbi:MAG: right-handed parallel beta-helix repeat-containing protein [Candidatus Hodarchaeota archaeon]